MRFAPTDDQLALRDAVTALLADLCPPTALHAAWAGDGRAPGLWPALAEMGVLGVLAPESVGGMGMTWDEMVLVLEAAGYAGVPDPLIEAAAVAIPALVACGEHDLASAAIGGDQLVLPFGFDVAHQGVFLAAAHVLIVRDDAEGLFVVDDMTAVPLVELQTVDRSRRRAQVVHAGGQLRDVGRVVPGGSDEVDASHRNGALGTAAFLVGAARRCLDMTVGYVSERQQFGVPVGSFQGLKHQLATAVMELEFARPAVIRAAHSLSTAAPTCQRDVAMAKAMASEAAHLVARTALQAHGAIGYTVEYDLHLWLKRIEALSRAWGSAAHHRSVVASALGLGR